MTANIIITDGTTTVTIYQTNVDHVLDQIFIEFAQPKTVQTESEGPRYRIGNLLKIKETFTVTGVIQATDTYTAIQQRDNFLSLYKSRKLLTITYGTITTTGYVKQLKFKEDSQDPETATDNPLNYDCTFMFLIGEKLI